jgi:hypothetical protein
MKPAIAVLLLIVATPLLAQEVLRASILATEGAMTWPVAINGQAVGWYLEDPREAVTVSARLGNGGGHAYVAAYLMKEIGPGTTEKDEIARTTFDLAYPHDGWVPLFENVDLEAGTYWLIVAQAPERAHSSINWFVAQPFGTVRSCGVRYIGSRSYTFHGDAAEYLPASKFAKKYEPYGFQFELTAVATVCETGAPE